MNSCTYQVSQRLELERDFFQCGSTSESLRTSPLNKENVPFGKISLENIEITDKTNRVENEFNKIKYTIFHFGRLSRSKT